MFPTTSFICDGFVFIVPIFKKEIIYFAFFLNIFILFTTQGFINYFIKNELILLVIYIIDLSIFILKKKDQYFIY